MGHNNEEKKISILALLMCKLMLSIKRKKGFTFTYDFDKKDFAKKQYIIVADHASYDNFFNILAGWHLPRTLHGVAGDIHFHDPQLGMLANMIHLIPKKLFVPDMVATRKIFRTIKAGHSILIFPEGTHANCGITHPVSRSLVALLKRFEVDVILVTTNGAFLANPKFVREIREGKVEVNFSHLFTIEDLKTKSVEELQEKFDEKFHYNDFLWNEKERNHYRGKLPTATGIEKVIYHCPKCNTDGNIYTNGNDIVCKECGNTITMDDTYHIEPKTENDFLPYQRIDQWYLAQRHQLRKEAREEKIILNFNVNIHSFAEPGSKDMFEKVGEGMLKVDETGVTYTGSKAGENVNLILPITSMYGSSNQKIHYMILYYEKEMVAFTVNGADESFITRAGMLIEEYHALVNPDWEKSINKAYFE